MLHFLQNVKRGKENGYHIRNLSSCICVSDIHTYRPHFFAPSKRSILGIFSDVFDENKHFPRHFPGNNMPVGKSHVLAVLKPWFNLFFCNLIPSFNVESQLEGMFPHNNVLCFLNGILDRLHFYEKLSRSLFFTLPHCFPNLELTKFHNFALEAHSIKSFSVKNKSWGSQTSSKAGFVLISGVLDSYLEIMTLFYAMTGWEALKIEGTNWNRFNWN